MEHGFTLAYGGIYTRKEAQKMAELLAGFVVLLIIATLIAIGYKFRKEIKRFIHEPKYGTSWHPKRETILHRKIEDAEAELEWIKENAEKHDEPPIESK